MRVAVVGCGYVGLVSGVGLASVGHNVVGIDSDEGRLAAVAAGAAPFVEPGLDDALVAALTAGRFRVSGSLEDARDAEVVLLCVQTPPGPTGAVELGFVREAATVLAAVLAAQPGRRVVVVRSTVPPGTAETVVAPCLEAVEDVAVASNPEFLREGSALADFLHPDRVVVGVREGWAADLLGELYGPLVAPVLVTTPPTAELAKYASNALLATLVSFSNEVARLSEATPGVDSEDVLGIVHRDRRLTTRLGGEEVAAGIVAYLRAGCGYGGSCLPKDLAALVAYGDAVGETTQLLRAVESVNSGQAARLVDLAERQLGDLRGRRVAVLGAAFKAGTDDLRDSPALRVVAELSARGADVVVYDPLVRRDVLEVAVAGAEVAPSLEAALDGAAACFVTTLAPEFAGLERIVRGRDGDPPLVVDGRRGLRPDGFADGTYVGIGRLDRRGARSWT